VKRWNRKKGMDTENPKIDAFLEDVIAVCRKHGLTISHEDTHGAFVIEVASEDSGEWLLHAVDDTDPEPERPARLYRCPRCGREEQLTCSISCGCERWRPMMRKVTDGT